MFTCILKKEDKLHLINKYTRSIHTKNSILYDVFKEQNLFYAVELKNNKIVPAKSYSNKNIGDEDMRVVREWGQYILMLRGV